MMIVIVALLGLSYHASVACAQAAKPVYAHFMVREV
jgi:hypothetical protein